MAGTIKVPGIGPVKKPYVVAGVGLLGGILVYAYWKRAQAPSAALTEPTPSDTGSAATDTGSGYVEDSSAAGYNTVYPSGYAYGYPPTAGDTTGSSGTYTTNNEWAQAAEGVLSDQGVDTATSAAAISKILAGLTVTTDQKQMFLQAVGLLGDPPSGYPPIHTSDTPGQPSPAPSSGPLPAPKGIHAYAVGKASTGVAWFNVPVAGVKGYHVYMRGRSGAVATTHAGDTTTEVHGLSHGRDYYFHVRAFDANGHDGYSSSELHVRTKK